MRVEKYKRIIVSFGVLIASLLISTSGLTQQADTEKQVAAFKQAVQQSMAGLRKYEWVETTTVSLKGEVKSQKQNRCFYGPDGKVQKVPIDNGAAAQPEPSGRGGRLKKRIIAKKKEEMTEYMKAAVELVHKYVPPDPQLIRLSKDDGNITVQPVEGGELVNVSIRNFMKQGDVLSATLNVKSNSIIDINVATFLESQ